MKNNERIEFRQNFGGQIMVKGSMWICGYVTSIPCTYEDIYDMRILCDPS